MAYAITLIAMFIFVAHAAIAGSHIRNHDGHCAETNSAEGPGSNHDHQNSSVTSGDIAKLGSTTCCGPACAAALMPNDDPVFDRRPNTGIKPDAVPVRTGKLPDGPPHPPATGKPNLTFPSDTPVADLSVLSVCHAGIGHTVSVGLQSGGGKYRAALASQSYRRLPYNGEWKCIIFQRKCRAALTNACAVTVSA